VTIRVELPKGQWAEIAEADEITVEEKWHLERATVAATAANVRLERFAATLAVKVRNELTDVEKKREAELRSKVANKRLPKAQKDEAQRGIDAINTGIANMAVTMAYGQLSKDDQDAIDHYEAVRVLVFLRDWGLTPERPVPTSLDELRKIPNVVMKEIARRTAGIDITDLDFSFSIEGEKDPKAPTGDSDVSEEPAAAAS